VTRAALALTLLACAPPPGAWEPTTAVDYAAACVGLEGESPPIHLERRPVGQCLYDTTPETGCWLGQINGDRGVTLLVWPGWRWSDTSLVHELLHAAHGDPGHARLELWGEGGRCFGGVCRACREALRGTAMDAMVTDGRLR